MALYAQQQPGTAASLQGRRLPCTRMPSLPALPCRLPAQANSARLVGSRQRSSCSRPVAGRLPQLQPGKALRHTQPQLARRRAPLPAVCSAAAGAAAFPADNGAAAPLQQESGSKLLASIKGFLFYTVTFTLALPLFVTMLALAPFVWAFDRTRRLAQHYVNNIWAKVSTSLFYRVEIEGRENLPPNNQPAVYVANHQSFLDIYTLFHLDRAFKFISKTSNFYIPIIGWSMFLTGHVMLNRVDKRSQMACLGECIRLLKAGASVLFFPEGTRSKDGRMAEFKKGAFSVAAKAKVQVVPVTLVGTGKLMPNGQESRMYPGGVRVVIHKAIPPGDAQGMLVAAQKAIAGPLGPLGIVHASTEEPLGPQKVLP